MKTLIGIGIALAIGYACRKFNIPLPAPPTLTGVLLIVAIATGYWIGGR